MARSTRRAGFCSKALNNRLVATPLGAEDFNRNLSTNRHVLGAIDPAHPTFANRFDHAISVANNLPFRQHFRVGQNADGLMDFALWHRANGRRLFSCGCCKYPKQRLAFEMLLLATLAEKDIHETGQLFLTGLRRMRGEPA